MKDEYRGRLSSMSGFELERITPIKFEVSSPGLLIREFQALAQAEGDRPEDFVKEAMLRVIDDRRNDPQYLAGLRLEFRQFLVQPYLERANKLRSELESLQPHLDRPWGYGIDFNK